MSQARGQSRSKLSDAPEVQSVARRLGLQNTVDAASGVIDYALSRIEGFMRGYSISTLDDFVRLVATCLDVKIERIYNDTDVKEIAGRYGQRNVIVGSMIEWDFLGDAATEGLLIGNPYHGNQPGARRFVAFIDLRGKQRNRAYFTIWHELAHLLIVPPDEAYAPQRRSPAEEAKQIDPEERLVDRIAGKLAFYEPLFRPLLRKAISDEGELNFRAIEQAAGEASAGAITASLWATARATLRVIDRPACLLEVEFRHKASVERHLRKASGDLFGYEPEKEPRLKQCLRNEEARSSTILELRLKSNTRAAHRTTARSSTILELRRNMRVPEKTVLAKAQTGLGGHRHLSAEENQDWWETSDGGPLSPLPLKVCAVRRGSFSYGLVFPIAW